MNKTKSLLACPHPEKEGGGGEGGKENKSKSTIKAEIYYFPGYLLFPLTEAWKS